METPTGWSRPQAALADRHSERKGSIRGEMGLVAVFSGEENGNGAILLVGTCPGSTLQDSRNPAPAVGV